MDEEILKKYRNFISKLRKNRIAPEFPSSEKLELEIYKALRELRKTQNSSSGFVRANEIIKLFTEDIKIFKSEDFAVAYINDRTTKAQKSICRASLDNQALRNKTEAKIKYWKEKEKTLIKDLITYRYVTVLYSDTGSDKLERYNEFINNKELKKFHGSFYVAPLNLIPILSFIIIDGEEVITRAPVKRGNSDEYIVMRNEKVVELYQKYFEGLFQNGKSIKDNEYNVVKNHFEKVYKQ